MLSLALCGLQTEAWSAIDFAKAEMARVAGRGAAVELKVVPGGDPERFWIKARPGKAVIAGSDATGLMYGALEFAERLQQNPTGAWDMQTSGRPYLKDRGVNLFLTLPWNYERNDTDYSLEALTDPARWWFHNEDYWRTLFDLMARSRLNWLDIHGAWDISVTNAPNLWAYFVTSKSFPKVGVPDEIKRKNIEQLNHVIAMAHARGIRVSLMAYEANLRIPQNSNPGYDASESNVYQYTRECVEAMLQQVPKLDAIGFRIGESGRSESFFNCYREAIKNSGRDIPLITRSWITTKQRVLPLARASKDFTVEIKFNGEHWGAPYILAGGRVPNWYSYSFEDYLSDSGGTGQKMWPGNPAVGGGNWPSEPYKIVWQVRANGTHRIFPMQHSEWVRRSILQMKVGTASGFTIEGLDAYFPKSPDYFLADSSKKRYNWIHQRDSEYWREWGRLGYDPTSDLGAFSTGTASEFEAEITMSMLSEIVPRSFLAYSLGPDHRSHAPELEWGGDSNTFIQGQGFDTHTYIPINEYLANKATGGIDGRALGVQPLIELSENVQATDGPPISANRSAESEFEESARMLKALLRYNIARLSSAKALAEVEAQTGHLARNVDVEQILEADAAFQALASTTFYKPFTDKLRMHTNSFSWKTEAAKVHAEAERLMSLPKSDSQSPKPESGLVLPTHFSWKDNHGTIEVTAVSYSADRAWLLVKPLPSSTYFHKIPMEKRMGRFYASFPRERWGHCISVEFANETTSWRSGATDRGAPYSIVPSQPGPTPQIYNASEALTYLNPNSISTNRYSCMMLGTRAWAVFGGYERSMKRKLLEPVERGMRLLIFQQDFNRYKLDWLPNPLRFESGNWSTFDPSGALGLEKVETSDIMWQRFLPSTGWEIYGNGGVAKMTLGKGEVWVVSARLMQRMHIPSAARDFVHLLSVGGKQKPTILVDSCSEGADYSSSCHADLMNSHDIPFVTLGEVIAREQGMNSFKPIPGPISFDGVLNGHGSEIVNRFFRDEVIRLSKRPTPPTTEAFETERKRRKKELLRCLGLDPMPNRSPLNAKITGVIQCQGYHIEKLIFESRPHFFVTAHVFVPEVKSNAKLPAIINVNGHWAHKKAEDRLQLRSAFQALNGYIAIAIDSPGWSFEGNSLIERRAEGNHNDFTLTQAGTNATGFYVWDVIRAVDYLETRKDVDSNRIGITGASGGGLATLYAFAAEDRFKAAVPVVYMASMELAPDNGCLCNHVPGTSQIGDRSDVIAIQAPKPVYIMGAQNDGEFPPNAINLTIQKMKSSWELFGKDNDVYGQIYSGPHDYNQPMRESMVGFFNRFLKGVGDGSPVHQEPISPYDPEDRAYLSMPVPAPDERTMRSICDDSLNAALRPVTAAEAISINGGLPQNSPLKYKELGIARVRAVSFESEPGLVTPAVLILPASPVSRVRIVVADVGKQAMVEKFSNTSNGVAILCLDTVGMGELANIEMRYPVYLGRSCAFTGGWQIVRAAEAMKKYSSKIELFGDGALASQAVMWAGLMQSTFTKVTGTHCLKNWQQIYHEDFPPTVVQPRANLLGPIEELRKLVRNSTWTLAAN